MTETEFAAAVAEARRWRESLKGTSSTATEGKIKITGRGQSIIVDDGELRLALKQAKIQHPVPTLTVVGMLGISVAAKELGLTSLHESIWSLGFEANIYEFHKNGSPWGYLSPTPIHREAAQASPGHNENEAVEEMRRWWKLRNKKK